MFIYTHSIETYKLLQIISAIPVTTTEAERCFSTLKRVKKFLKNIMSADRPLDMLSIEKNMITYPILMTVTLICFAQRKRGAWT